MLVKVEQVGGAAWHESYRSCFFQEIDPDTGVAKVIAQRASSTPPTCTRSDAVSYVLNLGIPSGSLQNGCAELFEQAGYRISFPSRSYYPEIDDPEIDCLLVRAQDGRLRSERLTTTATVRNECGRSWRRRHRPVPSASSANVGANINRSTPSFLPRTAQQAGITSVIDLSLGHAQCSDT